MKYITYIIIILYIAKVIKGNNILQFRKFSNIIKSKSKCEGLNILPKLIEITSISRSQSTIDKSYKIPFILIKSISEPTINKNCNHYHNYLYRSKSIHIEV